ncbi:Autophagy protein Apg6 [Aphelenchoides besseyi]|nr:Autophagy protein Apg6 [Aphelenchoides besseyi]
MSPTNQCFNCQEKLDVHQSLKQPIAGGSSSNYPDQLVAVFENRNNEGPNVVNSGKLLELLCSSSHPLDVPLCRSCCRSISKDLDEQLGELENEYKKYKSVYENLVSMKKSSSLRSRWSQKEIGRTIQEADLKETYANLVESEADLMRQVEEQKEELKRIAAQDDVLYKLLRDNHRKLAQQSEENRSLNAKINYATEHRKQLSRTNALNMAFFIWTDGEYGTINGLRAGRLANDHVEWLEINAAFGQMALLLSVCIYCLETHIMCQHANLKLERTEIVPCGSHSFIRVTKPDKKVVECRLYGMGPWKPFGNAQLDQGIMAFVDCFLQLESRLKELFPARERILPYKLMDDKIIDQDSQLRMLMQFNSEERWTKAMKCLLLNLKRAMSILVANKPNPSNE